ncbi:MAG: two-component sensor histidine kinase [Roseburia sp.]|nr:two-component sensor histidine kinase [Roseburia sp.]
MKKRINVKFRLISAVAVIVTGICAMIIFYDILKEQIFEDLSANAKVIAMMNPELLVEELPVNTDKDGLRITLIEEDGTVIYDSLGGEDVMENHGNREEIIQAKVYGEGRAMRTSTISNEHTFYYAIQTEKGSILRIAKDSSSIYTLTVQMAGMMVLISIGVLLICVSLAKRLTKSLMAPIEKMADNIVRIEEDSVYEEMRPFVSTIKAQHVDILQHAKMRQEFTANVSHELKTPLTAISGYAELIANGMTTGEDTIRFASEIHRSSERLQHLINDIIKLSELDDSDLQLEFEEVDLQKEANACVANMRVHAERNDVSISVKGSSAKLQANKMLIEELLYNLCSNAVRYNKNGGSVTIITGIENGHAVLVVKDTGIGIPKDAQERVFERFYRVDKSRSKSTGGTGLGLAIVKHIVAQHEAQIFLESEVGKGTEIKVVF